MGKRTGIRLAQQSAHNEKEQAEKITMGFALSIFIGSLASIVCLNESCALYHRL